jgi:hypothetical protein
LFKFIKDTTFNDFKFIDKKAINYVH